MDPGYRDSQLKTTNLNIFAYSFSFFSLAPTFGNLLGLSCIYLTVTLLFGKPNDEKGTRNCM